MSDMRAALEAIQEQHKPVYFHGLRIPLCKSCANRNRRDMASPAFAQWPCESRRLADQGLGGGQDG